MKSIWQELNNIDNEEELSIIAEIIYKYQTNKVERNSSMYLLPDGTFLNLGNSGKGHSELAKYLYEKGVDKEYKIGEASTYLKELGWIRFNTFLKYVELPNISITQNQLDKLIEVIDFIFDSDIDDTGITINTDKDGDKNYGKDSGTDYVIDRIKKFYTYGSLHESIS